MGSIWSLLSADNFNGYEHLLETWFKQITSLESYHLCMHYMFEDQINHLGRIKVWFYATQCVYYRLPADQLEQYNDLVCKWFSVFERHCPSIHLEKMKNDWDHFRHSNVIHLNRYVT